MEAIRKFEDLLFDLSNDFTIYTQLFTEDDSVEVLNDFNPLIFGNYQKVLITSIFSKIARLLDPARIGKDKNLSLAYFIEKYHLQDDSEIKEEFEYIKEFYKNSNLKKYRNKVLSHNDASLAYRGESISIKIEAPDVEALISYIGNLFYLIKYKSGVSNVNAAIDPLVTLPFDKNGAAFIHKLKHAYNK
ncbi:MULTISPECIES: hypothetical protein [Shewanella]|uniref:HEPN AbiU2-like domain-containing protein n=1 Tax=Shewanella xiamenensis TaxID=332186 RepID=A0ABT6UIN5_9GAMM|nr:MULTISPECIES: hypothetical protein [Shewanella]MDI5833144.1 hypothetical protein [Shewanella xiamenensis]NSM25943.1 hypothetical protein [Shewanella sp. ZOR0012]